MRITLDIPDRVAERAERLARERGVSVSGFCARAVEEHVKAESRQRAVDAINAMLASPGPAAHRAPDPYRERRA